MVESTAQNRINSGVQLTNNTPAPERQQRLYLPEPGDNSGPGLTDPPTWPRPGLPPLKTSQHPGQQTSPRFNFSHGPVVLEREKQPSGCAVNHVKLSAAYRCARSRGDHRQIFLHCNAINYIGAKRERPVGTDELALNGLRETGRKNYALVVDLQLRKIPIWEDCTTQQDQLLPTSYDRNSPEDTCYKIYLTARKALLIHHFLTTQARPGLFPSEYTALLPNELLPSYQEQMDPLLEYTIELQNRYNEAQKTAVRNPINGRTLPLQLSNMLTYTLEAYPG